jgi:targeting protein for Xklp2
MSKFSLLQNHLLYYFVSLQLSLKSEPACNRNTIPKVTTPNPFHLHTEVHFFTFKNWHGSAYIDHTVLLIPTFLIMWQERGAEKEKKLIMELFQKELEEEATRVPKANPYPYTTDYPVVRKCHFVGFPICFKCLQYYY